MARRRRQRVHAIEIATAAGVDPKKFDWERFVQTGASAPKQHDRPQLTGAILYEIERIKRNGGHYVAPEDQRRFDAERN